MSAQKILHIMRNNNDNETSHDHECHYFIALRLLVEIMFSIFLPDGLLVCFFKVFGEDDISVLTHCLHASLKINMIADSHCLYRLGGGGHYIGTCTSIHDRSQDLDPPKYRA